MPETIETDVVVVGAGIAEAHRRGGAPPRRREGRRRRGTPVSRVGGRVWNTEIGGQANELGGQWIAPYQSAMHALLAELGLELFKAYRDGDRVYVDREGTAHLLLRPRRPARRRRRAGLRGAAAKLDALAASTRPRGAVGSPGCGGARPDHLRRLARAGGRGRGRPRHARLLPLRRLHDEAGTHLLAARRPLDDCRAGSVDNLFEPDLCLNSRVVGGSQLIPIRLAERTGDRVLLDAPARTCRWRDGAVTIELDTRRVTARRAVVAVPPNLTGAIRFDPVLPPGGCAPSKASPRGA